MALVKKRLAGPIQLTAAAVTRYTAPARTPAAVIDRIHLYNADSSARTVTISIGADAAGTRLYDAYSIPAASPYDVYGPFTLASGEIVQALADVTLKVTLTIDGREENS
jgi:hypothetical protein